MNENRTGKPAPSHGQGHGETLAGTAKVWPTPKATDASRATPGDLRRNTPGRQAVTTSTDGSGGSPTVDLNPFFVATLMGLPMDWLTLSTSAVTALCRRQLHTPSDSYLSAAGGS